MKNRAYDFFPFFIVILALLSFVRSMFLHDVIWDDNCWVLSYYSTSNLKEFLSTGFYELRRVPMGTFMYYYYSLHKLSDYTYLIWNSINMAVQILSPLFLYFFINNLFKGKRLLAFLIASSFIVCLLDNTLPYYISITYRMGTLFCIVSLYLTERSLAKGTRWGFLLVALAASAFSSYVLMETTIALEPARLLLIGYILSRKHFDLKALMKRSLVLWLPFILTSIPLVVFKLVYRPYGIYESIYSVDPLFFLNFKLHAKVLRHFMFYNWLQLSNLIGNTSTWSVGLGLLALIVAFFLSRRLTVSGVDESVASKNPTVPTFRNSWLNNWKSVRSLFIFGVGLMAPVLIMYEFAGRVPAPGMEGRHGTILLFGYAIAFGSLLYCLYRTTFSIRSRQGLATLLIVLFLGLGVFFNNVNLDLYSLGVKYQKRFWRAFTARFPTLPEKATFLMDVRGDDPFYYYADLEAYYELELPLNILYARLKDPEKFRNYMVYAVSEGIREEWKKSDAVTFQRLSHSGRDVFDSQELIVVHYRGDKILVNSEILEKYPDVPYRMWLDKDPPEFSGTVPEYPLRYKFKGFY